MPVKGDSTSIVERILRRCRRSKSGCLEFTGCLADGYGYISSDKPGGSAKRVHIVMWEEKYGPVPRRKPAVCVLHKCDNRRCCEPNHLFLGTRKQNNDDMIHKGRAVLSHKGSRNPAAKLNERIVKMILKSDKSCRRLGIELGVSTVMVAKIKRRENWRHVNA